MKKMILLIGCIVAQCSAMQTVIPQAEILRRIDDSSQLFTFVQSDEGSHPNFVNLFGSVNEVYKAYSATARDFELAVPPISDQIGSNEIKAKFDFIESINPRLRNFVRIMASNAFDQKKKWQPLEQFKACRGLFFAHNNAEIGKLQTLATAILQWLAFEYAGKPGHLSLEYVTDQTCTTARTIDNLNAFLFAKYLGTKAAVSADDWQTFTKTPEYQKTLPMRMLIEHITQPRTSENLPQDKVGMPIASALRDFRAKNANIDLLPKLGNAAVEKFFTDKLPIIKQKFDTMKAIVDSYGTKDDLTAVEVAYDDLAANPQGKMEAANDLRREIGAQGFLDGLMTAINARFISRGFFNDNLSFIKELVTLTNNMDKANFERNLKFGSYDKDDNKPAPYIFFEDLFKEC